MGYRTKKEVPQSKPIYQSYISLSEYSSRKKAWDEYYTKVLSTRAYKRFVEAREALGINDMMKVKQIAEEARQAVTDGTQELITPAFPDPEIERRYGRLGVKEWDDFSIVEEAKNIFKD